MAEKAKSNAPMEGEKIMTDTSDKQAVRMNRRRFFTAAGGFAGLTALATAFGSAAAKAAETPIGPKWWPSKWGKGDQKGATNYMTPQKTLEATQLIKTGKVHSLGRVYEAEMPLFGNRAFSMRTPGAPTGGTFGDNKIVWNDEFLCTEIGQVGTQFDGLAHIGVEAGKSGDKSEQRFYNGFTTQEMSNAYGVNKLGVEQLDPFFTRGVLMDVQRLRGRRMNKGEEITAADLQAALKAQNMSEADIRPGDAVFVNTGWGSLWKKDNATFNSGAPGIGVGAAEWLIGKQVSLVGADTWPVEVVPNPDAKLAFPVHQMLITRNGIFIHENLAFDSLIADGSYSFAYIFSPMKLKGGTGSPGSPLAVT
jgi:kynurenine formamidase